MNWVSSLYCLYYDSPKEKGSMRFFPFKKGFSSIKLINYQHRKNSTYKRPDIMYVILQNKILIKKYVAHFDKLTELEMPQVHLREGGATIYISRPANMADICAHGHHHCCAFPYLNSRHSCCHSHCHHRPCHLYDVRVGLVAAFLVVACRTK